MEKHLGGPDPGPSPLGPPLVPSQTPRCRTTVLFGKIFYAIICFVNVSHRLKCRKKLSIAPQEEAHANENCKMSLHFPL